MAAKKQVEKETSMKERWVSLGARSHNIIIKCNGKSRLIKFEDYSLELDLDNAGDAEISNGLHSCTREGRDIFVVRNTPYAENEIDKLSEMVAMLRSMTVQQLRAMLDLDDLINAGVQANTTDVNALIAVITRTKSF